MGRQVWWRECVEPAQPRVTAFAYLWVALYPAWFHGQRAALAHLALIGLGLVAAHPAAWSAGVAAWQSDDLDAWLGRADDDLYVRKADRSATSSDPSARATLAPWTTCADGGR